MKVYYAQLKGCNPEAFLSNEEREKFLNHWGGCDWRLWEVDITQD